MGYVIVALFGMFFLSTPIQAVEIGGIQIVERWSVVGVITDAEKDGQQTGVVVIKDIPSQKTFTLPIGSKLPSDPTFKIMSAGRRQVVVSDGVDEFVIGPIQEDDAEDDSRSGYGARTRFADNYYDDPLIPYVEPQVPREQIDPEDIPMPLGQFGNMTDEEFRERLEQFRGKRKFFDDDRSGRNPDYVVTYDGDSEVETDADGNGSVWKETMADPNAELEPGMLEEVVDYGENYTSGDDFEPVQGTYEGAEDSEYEEPAVLTQ
jgi:hypothetical protein